MRGSTHLILGLVVYLSYIIITGNDVTGSSLLAAMIFALLPDIDSPYSTISQTTPVTKMVSEKINITLGHRGPLHSLFFRSVITILLRYSYSVGSLSHLTYVSASLGYLSHIVADAFTPRGVPLFRPVLESNVTVCKKRGFRRRICVKTGSHAEDMLATFLTFVLMALIGLYFGLYPRWRIDPSFIFP